jgi:hypothetical protein
LEGPWCCWWCCLRYFYGQPSLELTWVGLSSGWEHAVTLVGSLIPLVHLVDFLALLLASSVGFRFSLLMEFLYGRYAIIVALSVPPLAGLFLRTASVYTPSSYAAPYSWLHLNNWWIYLLVSTFWTVRVHFGPSPTDTRVPPARRSSGEEYPTYTFHDTIGVGVFWCGVFVFQPERFNVGIH